MTASARNAPALPGAGAGPLRRLAFDAARVEVLAHVAGQLLRFGSSLVLSRLLFPEAFGLSVLVGLVCQGLVMVSNVGAAQSIVHSQRGGERAFLDTAFTVLALRGAAIWLVACAMAWPLAWLMDQPQLRTLLPVGSLSVVLLGLGSTGLVTWRRQLRVRPLVALELATQLVTLAANVLLAWKFRSVWSLIAGGLIGNVFQVVAGHVMAGTPRNRFTWDRDAWREIYGFGRWIQASSAVSFASGQVDRFLTAHYAGAAMLGVYNIAMLLAEAMSAVVLRLANGVLFPVFSRLQREQPERLANAYYAVRLRVDTLTLLPMGIIAAVAQPIVSLLFDARYADAGWMLRLLCLRTAMICVLAPAESFLLSTGRTRYGFLRDTARAAWLLPAIPVGWHLAGMQGLVTVVALSEVPAAFVLWHGMRRAGCLRLSREVVGPLALVSGALLGWGLQSCMGLGVGR